MSQQFPPVSCPLCRAPWLWLDRETCPACDDRPARGMGMISRFKLPGLFAQFPELARIDTEREMHAVKPKD